VRLRIGLDDDRIGLARVRIGVADVLAHADRLQGPGMPGTLSGHRADGATKGAG
jgi:hypothetical protein